MRCRRYFMGQVVGMPWQCVGILVKMVISMSCRGGGEFGRGFYTQSSLTNAHRRGYLIYGSSKGAVLILDIPDVEYHTLRFWRLSLNRAQQLNARLRGPARRNFVTTHDVIIGPLVSFHHVEQQKYQSATAQSLLNGSRTQRSVI